MSVRDFHKDIASLRRELVEIAALRKTVKTDGWVEVIKTFNGLIGRFYQDVFDKCDKPAKNEVEIKCKKMVAEALGSILATLDSRVRNEEFIKQKLLKMEVEAEDAKDRQELQTI